MAQDNENPGMRLSVSERRVGQIVDDKLKTFGDLILGKVKLWLVLAFIGSQGVGQYLAASNPETVTRAEAAVLRLLALL